MDDTSGSVVSWLNDRTALRVWLGGTVMLGAGAVLSMALAFAAKMPCRSGSWNSYSGQFQHFCYTDIYPLYWGEGLAAGKVPYTGHPVEYPVITGYVMQAATWLASKGDGKGFFDITVLLLSLCGIVGIAATAYAAGPRWRWTAWMVALSPALILSAFINWDLIAMALGMLGLAFWARRRVEIAGVCLGLAVAAKFYPLVIFVPLLLLCVRTGQLRAFGRTAAAAAAAWLAVNVPVMIVAFSGWGWFYRFSKERGADWGSVWYFFEHKNIPLLGDSQLSMLNLMSAAFLLLACVGIGWLALTAPRRPRLAQLCYLVLAAFLITNKVWSPQYVVWLVPLAVLARPRWGMYLVWQAAELGYYFGIWSYLLFVYREQGAVFAGYQGISTGPYFALLLFRLFAVVALSVFIIRDVLVPGGDIVRAAGDDDPCGGIFDNAPDRFRLSQRASAAYPGVSQITDAPAA